MRRCGKLDTRRGNKNDEDQQVKIRSWVQCLKRLYWQVHKPELAGEPDTATEGIVEQGREVGCLHVNYSPVASKFTVLRGSDQAIRTTKELVANPKFRRSLRECSRHQGVVVKSGTSCNAAEKTTGVLSR